MFKLLLNENSFQILTKILITVGKNRILIQVGLGHLTRLSDSKYIQLPMNRSSTYTTDVDGIMRNDADYFK